jgi:uncharacterized damage-inducible protein DinB
MKPTDAEFNPYFKRYIEQADDEILLNQLINSEKKLNEFLIQIDNCKAEYSYADKKWTVKQVLIHLIDCERIFSNRALCIARGETQNLPGFDENEYAENCNASKRTLTSIINEFKIVRKCTISLFENLHEDDLFKVGLANNSPVSVRALGYIILGHQNHHFSVLVQKYALSIN